MTTETRPATPNLIPTPPDWLQRQGKRGPTTNRNINDIYWMRADDESDPGQIMVGPSALLGGDGRMMTAQAEWWQRRGRKPLIEYSYTNRVSPITGHRETIELNEDRLNTPDWAYWFFVNGGVHLFPIEQIVEMHWHITPPYGLALDVFPQLREWEVPEPFYCGACQGSHAPFNAESELVKHLLVWHSFTRPQAMDLIASYDVHSQPRGPLGLSLRRKAVQVEADAEPARRVVSPDLPVSGKFICNTCGEEFENAARLSRHENRAHGVAASQPDDAMNGQAESKADA